MGTDEKAQCARCGHWQVFHSGVGCVHPARILSPRALCGCATWRPVSKYAATTNRGPSGGRGVRSESMFEVDKQIAEDKVELAREAVARWLAQRFMPINGEFDPWRAEADKLLALPELSQLLKRSA